LQGSGSEGLASSIMESLTYFQLNTNPENLDFLRIPHFICIVGLVFFVMLDTVQRSFGAFLRADDVGDWDGVEMPRHLPQIPNRSFEPSPHITYPLATTRLISPAFSS
jgi:hypothetical protein